MNGKPAKNWDRERKIDAMVEWLTEDHLHIHGGYPLDYERSRFPAHVIVADLDDGKDRQATRLQIYRKDFLVAWFNAAADLLREDPTFDWSSALNEVSLAVSNRHRSFP